MTELTDLEVCVRIAEIEGAKETLFTTSKPKTLTAVFDDRTTFDYNPINNKELCFDLMIKHGVNLERYMDEPYCASISKVLCEFPFGVEMACCPNNNPQMAICLAIIEASAHE